MQDIDEDTPKTTISHLGKSFETIHFSNITDEECTNIKNEFFTKPSLYEVRKDLYEINRGNTNTSKIHKYFFSDLMYDSKLYSSKWSINEFFECNDLIRFAYAKVKKFPNVFPTEVSDADNINTVLRLSPSGTAAKLSNYPIYSVHNILNMYNVNNNYYDYSCGWGVRLLGALSRRINYFGTDPNCKLVNKLLELNTEYTKINKKNSTTDIRCLGSEIYIPEWENTIGVAFSSPPYYDLEDYKYGEQSIKTNSSYAEWLSNYWTNTVRNIFRYLINDGFFLLNIKSFKGLDLLNDMKQITINEGFIYSHSLDLQNQNRPSLKHNDKNNNEEILVFTKMPNVKPKIVSLDYWE